MGIVNGRGKYIHFLDADDWMTAGAYSTMIAPLLNDPALAGAYCGMKVATQSGIITKEYQRRPEESITFEKIALGNKLTVHSVLIRRDVLNIVGAFDETLQHCQDWDLWGRLFRCGFRLIPVPGAFAVYRMVRTSLSTRHGTFWRSGIKVLQRMHQQDKRCRSPLPIWANGADKRQYPVAIKSWGLYCLPRAILTGDLETVNEIVAAFTSEPRALPEAHESGSTLLRGLVICHPDGPGTFPAVWNSRAGLVLDVVTRIGVGSRNSDYVNDTLGRLLWGVQRTIGIRASMRMSSTMRYVPRFLCKELGRRTRRLLLTVN
jgi:hypothetical protein